jgi:hypothetical protein
MRDSALEITLELRSCGIECSIKASSTKDQTSA